MRSSVISLGVLFMPGFAHAQAEATPSVRSRLPSDSFVWGMFAAADWLVQAAMVGLVVASVITWTVFVAKSLEIASTARRQRQVLTARIERTSGVASLDQEGLDLLQRAQPLPPLRSDQPSESLELVVPIQFHLTR